MFKPLPARFDFPDAEKRVLAFWDQHDIFAQTLRNRAAAQRFVFFEGPPTANGMPHPGHCLTRAIKDLFPRYQTMCGKLVERKAGWDTHGLPVEREVEKELGLQGKADIEKYGVEKFVHKCIQSVWKYTREWEEMTRRLGFWVNLREAYVTYHQSYVESVWWSLKTLFERGLLYQAHKVVWWWAQGGTALSAGEVGEGYRTVDDPSVYVKFPLGGHSPLVLPPQFPMPSREEYAKRVWELVQDAERSATTFHAETSEQNYLDQRIILNFLARVPGFLVDPDADELRTLVALRDRGEHVVEKLTYPNSLLVWTTTPWTLISNQFAAVHPELDYSLVHDPIDQENLFIASALVDSISKKSKRELETVLTCKGTDLLEEWYHPPFPETYFKQLTPKLPVAGWRVLSADFVTIESGTGIVHEAPAFGEVDFDLLQKERARHDDPTQIPLLCAVAPDGTFNDDAPEKYRGRFVKDCDKDIARELKERTTPWGTPLLFHQEQIKHEYPFCPRAENDPLIQYARKSWFVRTSQFKDEFLANNDKINWLPDHIKEGRFGDFLRNNVDWALSRERFWGTPRPIWRCEKTGQMEAIGSFAELQSKPGATDGGFWDSKVAEHKAAGDAEMPSDLRVHKPYIDAWTYDSPFAPGAKMNRVIEVIDCWWDAGSMPFAQWGFPHTPNSERVLEERFPADFISEAIDQTRGWFYGLLSISTMLFGPAVSQIENRKPKIENRGFPIPYRTCIVLGLIAGEDGNKMSKRLRNYKEPSHIFDSYGADAMRWYFFSAQAPWTSVRFQEAAIRDSHREFLVKLYNVLSFFTIYASIDGFGEKLAARIRNVEEEARGASHFQPSTFDIQHSDGWRPTAERSELDRWIVTELHQTVTAVRAAMDRFENYPAAQKLNDFVDALSNWFVRRSRDRFWRPVHADAAANQDKWDAYHTLYGCLLTFSKLIAPFTPFFAETMYQTLVGIDGAGSMTSWFNDEKSFPKSVHLCDYPTPEDIRFSDPDLAVTMDTVRDLVALGRSARTTAKLKVRQPLPRVEIVLTNSGLQKSLEAHDQLIAEELNVKKVEFTTEADHYVSYKVVPNFKALGPKFGGLAPKIAGVLKQLADPAAARRELLDTGELKLSVDGQPVALTPAELEIRLEAKPGWSAAQGRAGVVVLSTEVPAELRDEGLINELVHHVQTLRKEQDLPYAARITLFLDAPPEFLALARKFQSVLQSECLVSSLDTQIPPALATVEVDIEGTKVRLTLRQA